MMHTALRTFLLLSALIAVAVGCSLRPQPEPPPAEPGPEIDLDLLSASPSSPAAMVSGSLSGAPGACPASARVRAYNLESTLAPVETTADDDGSFSMFIDIAEGDEVRLQAFAGEQRTRPLDVIISAQDEPPAPATRALDDCLSFAPALELNLGDLGTAMPIERSVIVANGCATAVTVGAVAMRRPVDGLTITTQSDLPLIVQPGTSTPITVGFEAPAEVQGEVEEILLVEIVSPQLDRRPITIYGVVRP